jgi:hypothetical protein
MPASHFPIMTIVKTLKKVFSQINEVIRLQTYQKVPIIRFHCNRLVSFSMSDTIMMLAINCFILLLLLPKVRKFSIKFIVLSLVLGGAEKLECFVQ